MHVHVTARHVSGDAHRRPYAQAYATAGRGGRGGRSRGDRPRLCRARGGGTGPTDRTRPPSSARTPDPLASRREGTVRPPFPASCRVQGAEAAAAPDRRTVRGHCPGAGAAFSVRSHRVGIGRRLGAARRPPLRGPAPGGRSRRAGSFLPRGRSVCSVSGQTTAVPRTAVGHPSPPPGGPYRLPSYVSSRRTTPPAPRTPCQDASHHAPTPSAPAAPGAEASPPRDPRSSGGGRLRARSTWGWCSAR